ncbi:MAG: hypothetical protein OXT72_06575 [Gammaproteobacteria bacterium]|nr:hypothetical protein [Gammaproteobacteria bacterium]MDE0247963.1 hypothetical protein [Gammaproteobacteria bacterium]
MNRAQADPGGRTVDFSIERVRWTYVSLTHGHGRCDRRDAAVQVPLMAQVSRRRLRASHQAYRFTAS